MQRISPSFITFVSMKSDKRVLLGMSGGTDSSVAAMRLQEAGYEVTGVTFRFYEAGDAPSQTFKNTLPIVHKSLFQNY